MRNTKRLASAIAIVAIVLGACSSTPAASPSGAAPSTAAQSTAGAAGPTLDPKLAKIVHGRQAPGRRLV